LHGRFSRLDGASLAIFLLAVPTLFALAHIEILN